MPTFEVYFEDLTPEAQQRYLEWMKIENSDEGNFEFTPIVIFESEKRGI